MPYLLPDNIDPDEFGCIRVYYPKSTGYRRAVMGAISELQHWYMWDRDEEKRATVAAAKYREAYSLTVADILSGKTCEDTTDKDPEQAIDDILAAGGGIVIEVSDMGQVVTDVKIVDGKLRVFYGHCCYEDLDMQTVKVSTKSTDGNLPDRFIEETGLEESPTYTACAKATAVVNLVYACMEGFWDARDELNQYDEYLPAVKSKLPEGITINLVYMALGVAEILLIDGYGSRETWDDDIKKATVICQFAALMEDDEVPPTDDQIKQLINIFLFTYKDPIVSTVASNALSAIGYGDVRDVARMGATQDVTCDCPDPEAPAVAENFDWYVEFDFTSNNYTLTTFSKGSWVSGEGLKSQSDPGGVQRLQWTLDATSAIAENVVLEYVYEKWSVGDLSGTVVADQPLKINASHFFLPATIMSDDTPTWSGSMDQGLASGFDLYTDFGVATDDTMTLEKLILAGSGENPFPTMPPTT